MRISLKPLMFLCKDFGFIPCKNVCSMLPSENSIAKITNFFFNLLFFYTWLLHCRKTILPLWGICKSYRYVFMCIDLTTALTRWYWFMIPVIWIMATFIICQQLRCAPVYWKLGQVLTSCGLQSKSLCKCHFDSFRYAVIWFLNYFFIVIKTRRIMSIHIYLFCHFTFFFFSSTVVKLLWHCDNWHHN